MYVKKKKNRSQTTSVVVCEKIKGKYREHITIGISSDENEIERLVEQGKEWIRKYQSRHSPELDLYGEETEAKRKEVENTQAFLSNIENILLNGDQLILDRIFDRVGFNEIEDEVFRSWYRLECHARQARLRRWSISRTISTRMWICRRYTVISTGSTIRSRTRFRTSAYIIPASCWAAVSA